MTEPKASILLIDDEPQMRRFLRVTLQGHGYRLYETSSGQEGLVEGTTRNPDVVLLDLGLPDMDGIEVTKRFREWSNVPIIVISAREQEEDKVEALDAGADDYLTKPFGAEELLARIRVALRHRTLRAAGQNDPLFVIDDLRVDLAARQVFIKDKEIHLTPIEYRLLSTLVRHAGKVVTHTLLLKEVWGPVYTDQQQYLHVHMAQLRKKLESDPARPRLLINEPGVGYRLKLNV
ncbi:MAG TPA: response regulator [Candidatus Sulfobium mesophilum]|jgi:two-component system KDP operon response regulator KdpE|nr:response regulator [Candidatus Sulfobium mesophilum]